jgi:hypothetical protein
MSYPSFCSRPELLEIPELPSRLTYLYTDTQLPPKDLTYKRGELDGYRGKPPSKLSEFGYANGYRAGVEKRKRDDKRRRELDDMDDDACTIMWGCYSPTTSPYDINFHFLRIYDMYVGDVGGWCGWVMWVGDKKWKFMSYG